MQCKWVFLGCKNLVSIHVSIGECFQNMQGRAKYTMLEDFLEIAINEEPENLCVFNLLAPENSSMCSRLAFEELMSAGIADVFISFSLDEKALLISMNRDLLQPYDIFMKLKALHFE